MLPGLSGRIERGRLPRAEEQGCSASYSESFNWYLAKSWNCDTGKRTVTVIYTLTSP